jgi:hypothetical protein
VVCSHPLNNATFVLTEGNLETCFIAVKRPTCFLMIAIISPFFVALSVAAYTNLGHACSVIDLNTVGISSLYIVPLLLEDASPFRANRLLCFHPFLQTC